MKYSFVLQLLLVLITFGAFAIMSQQSKAIDMDGYVSCKEPRPVFCPEIYSPVCALIDTGIRCIMAPCPVDKYETRPNSCQARISNNLYGYLPGVCSGEIDENPGG